MKIHKNKLKKYIREILKEAYLRDKNGNAYVLPAGLEPRQVYDVMSKNYYNEVDGTGTYAAYRKKYGEMDFYNRLKAREEGRPYKDQTINIRDPELLTMPVIQAGVKTNDEYIGTILAPMGMEYVIEPGDFAGMTIDGISVEKEILPRLDGSHRLEPKEKGEEGAPFRIEVLSDETLSAPPQLRQRLPGEITQQMSPMRNTVPLDDDETEEAIGVYPRTEDIPEDYDEDATMDISDHDLSVMSGAERVAHAKSQVSRLNPGVGEQPFLPTGVVQDYDAYKDETIGGPLPDLAKGSTSRQYMDVYRGRTPYRRRSRKK